VQETQPEFKPMRVSHLELYIDINAVVLMTRLTDNVTEIVDCRAESGEACFAPAHQSARRQISGYIAGKLCGGSQVSLEAVRPRSRRPREESLGRMAINERC